MKKELNQQNENVILKDLFKIKTQPLKKKTLNSDLQRKQFLRKTPKNDLETFCEDRVYENFKNNLIVDKKGSSNDRN